ncbi:hypothetical protein D3C77_649170 [compost metagenome]
MQEHLLAAQCQWQQGLVILQQDLRTALCIIPFLLELRIADNFHRFGFIHVRFLKQPQLKLLL